MKQRPVVIYGNESFASLLWCMLINDARREVAGFTLDKAYLRETSFHQLPVVPFEEVEKYFPPDEFEMAIPLGMTRMNGFRKDRFLQAKGKGYQFASYISKDAWIGQEVTMGENCLIFEHAVIQPFSSLGDNVVIRSGVNVGHHSIIGNHSFIASEAVLGGELTMGERVFVGLGAVLRNKIKVADRTLIGAGSVLLVDTQEDSTYFGNPARKTAETSTEN